MNQAQVSLDFVSESYSSGVSLMFSAEGKMVFTGKQSFFNLTFLSAEHLHLDTGSRGVLFDRISR